MKSTLEDFHDKLMKNGRTFSDDEFKEIYSIMEFLKGNKELDYQIMSNAAKTIKTIQPSILLSDFKIAMSMVYSVVTNAIYYLEKNGYIEIKKEVKR